MEDFSMFITSLDSKENYPDNNYCRMSVDLQEAIELHEKDDCYWTVGLVDIAISDQTSLTQSNVILLCDLVFILWPPVTSCCIGEVYDG